MSAPLDPDRLFGAFLQDGPAELSPRLLQAIRDDVQRTDQRASRRPWTPPAMPRSLLILAPLVALLLIAGALAFAGGAGKPTSVPASPAASAAVVAPTPAASSTPPGASPVVMPADEPWIVFAANDGSVALVRPDGSGRHTLLANRDRTQALPDWSPDGSQVVFQRVVDYGSGLWVTNADGTAGRWLTRPDGGCLASDPCPLLPQWPRWSPDGRSVAFVTSTGSPTRPTSSALSVVDVATGEVRVLFESSRDVLGGLSWSPDSRRLVLGVATYPSFATSRADGVRPTTTTIAVLDATSPGAVPVPITGAPALAAHPDWSPDGSLVVFATNPFVNGVLADTGGPTTIAAIAPAGGTPTTLLSSAAGRPVAGAPSWTPDGSGILYSALDPASGLASLRIVDADGSNDRSATGSVTISGAEPRLRPVE